MGTENTRHPGVYRRGGRWRYTWWDVDGKRHWGTADTESEALRERSCRTASRVPVAGITVQAFARDWVARYPGRAGHGISDETRAEYRSNLEMHVLPFLGARLRMIDLKPRHVGALYQHLVSDDGPALADVTVRKVVAPLKAMLFTAVGEGLLAVNPASVVRLPVRPQVEEDDELPAKTLTDAELARLVDAAAPEWRCLLLVLALAGLRISEALALRWKDIDLGGPVPLLLVRRRVRAGAFSPPKSRHGRRGIPLTTQLTATLLEHRETVPDDADDLVFPGPDGQPWTYSVILEPAIKRPARATGVEWAAFHSLRHTCAMRLFADGASAAEVQQQLGHHSPAFTARKYAWFLDNVIVGSADVSESGDDPEPAGGFDRSAAVDARSAAGALERKDHVAVPDGRM